MNQKLRHYLICCKTDKAMNLYSRTRKLTRNIKITKLENMISQEKNKIRLGHTGKLKVEVRGLLRKWSNKTNRY